MKKYTSLLMFCSVFILLFQLLTSCNEDNTLEGAKEVYITISPSNPFIMVGDTIALQADVVNLNGDRIDARVQWKSDDANIVKIEEGKMMAQEGAQGKSTKIRAILENGKFALITVTVTAHVANGVAPFEEIHYTYSTKSIDTVWFAIDPIQLLLDYVPTVTNSDPELLIPSDKPIYVDKKVGKVGYVFSCDKQTIGGGVTITLSIGAVGSEKTGSTEVIVSPSIISSLGTDFNLITLEMSKIMDINQVDTVWVNTKIDPTYDVDLAIAEKLYHWTVEGNAAQWIKTGVKVAEGQGHRAYAVLRSGQFTGETVVKFECNGIILTTTIDVQNFAIQYPVDVLSVDKLTLELPIGTTGFFTPTVVPLSSYGIHLPKFTPNDPTIVQMLGYNGVEMELKGIKAGETDIVITSNDKSVVVHVKVLERVLSVVLASGNKNSIFEGQTTQWFATVNTSGGSSIQPIWKSEDPAVASINAEGVINGKTGGKVSITAEAGGVSSQPGQLTVIGIPTADVVYNNSNTNLDGNAVFVENDHIIVLFEPTITEPFRDSRLIIKPQVPVYEIVDATYSATNSQISLEANGALAGVSSGSITISSGSDSGTKNVNADVTVTVGSKSFKVKLNNLSVYI